MSNKTTTERINLLNETACLKAAEEFHNAMDAYEKVREKTVALVEKLETDHQSKIDKLESQLREEKQKRLAPDEQKRYDKLAQLTKQAHPLKTILYLMNARFIDNEWQMLSSDGKTVYNIPEDLAYCPCAAFGKGACPHIPALVLRSQIEWSKLK
jgi:hypothetical protein